MDTRRPRAVAPNKCVANGGMCRDMNGLGRASCSMTSGRAKSLSSSLFWSQSYAPCMVRMVVTIVSVFPVVAMAHCHGTDIAGLGHTSYILVM